MMRALLLLCAVSHPGIARAQRPPAVVPRNNETAVSDSVIATWIGQYPDRARDSVRTWLARAASADSEIAAGALVRAEQVGTGYVRIWGDSFPLLLVHRFTDWPQHNRTLWARADSLRTVGNAALGKEGVTVAIRDWRASIQVARELGDTALVAAAIGNIGAAFYRGIELDSAKRYFAQARRLADLAGDRRTLLNALGGLASVNKDQGHLQAAAAQYTEAIALRRQIGDYRGVAADDNNLGLVAAAVGDDAEARRRHVESLVIAREHGLDEAAAAALVNLGVLSDESGDAVTAGAQYDEALSLYRKLDDPADAALVLDNLGLLESGQGQYPLAVTHFKASLEILRRTGPIDLVVGVRRDLAIVFAAMGNLGEAGRQITAAERFALHGTLRPATNGRLELVRGDLALDFNRFPAARAAYSAGLTLLRRAQDQAGEADALTALGTLDLMEEDNASARDLLARAATRQDLLGHRRAAAIARLLGAKAAREAGDTTDARTMIAATLDSLRKDGDPVEEAWALCQRGDLERATGAALAAEATYRKGLDRLGRRPAPSAAICLFGGLGESLRGRGALGDAESVFDHGVRSIERTANDLPVSGERADYLTDKWRLYADLGSTQHAAGNDSMAFQTSERMRARETLDMLVRGPVTRPASSGLQADARAAALRRRITALMDVGGPQDSIVASRGADALGRFPDVQREALARAQQAYATLLDSLDHDRPDGTPRASSPTPGWREVAARLPSDEALVEFLVTDSTTIAFVITAEHLAAVTLPVTGAELATEVDFVRGVLAASPATVRGKLWRAPLATLHSQLIAPIERAGLLRNTHRLLIVPHRELHYLPFAALVEGGSAPAFMVQRYTIGYVSSAAIWLTLMARAGTLAPVSVLALAPRVGDLPGASAEVAAIADIYGADARVLRGDRATRQALVDDAERHSVIHLASLGVLNKDNPLFSFVVLAPSKESDGRLEVHDVFGMHLPARLVVLSACHTGLGSGRAFDVPPGDDWVGLVQAFHTAGAAKVVATLWAVNDQATAQLMRRFYAELRAGGREADALAIAQRSALANPDRAAPAYWAAFTIDGTL